jgi:hypothetical protein
LIYGCETCSNSLYIIWSEFIRTVVAAGLVSLPLAIFFFFFSLSFPFLDVVACVARRCRNQTLNGLKYEPIVRPKTANFSKAKTRTWRLMARVATDCQAARQAGRQAGRQARQLA